MQVFFGRGLKLPVRIAILNFDGSVSHPDIESIDLRDQEEDFRYFCSLGRMKKFSALMKDKLTDKKIFHIGSGDLHHVTYALLGLFEIPGLHVVVFDNHPDNMIFPGGIHCGSWVYHASKLPFVSRISVIGITSGDIGGINVMQNRYAPLRNGKVSYYCLRKVPGISSFLSRGGIRNISGERMDLPAYIRSEIIKSGEPVYLSVDKDVLCESSASSTWDQGVLSVDELIGCIDSFSSQIIAADICGEISSHTFRNNLKRFLRMLDGKEKTIANHENEIKKHMGINSRLYKSILTAE